jgi:hypothetical protein
MNNYAHPDFEGMLKEEANQSCFDCGRVFLRKVKNLLNGLR